MKKDKSVQFRLTKEANYLLELVARKWKVTKSEATRICIRDFLKNSKSENV